MHNIILIAWKCLYDCLVNFFTGNSSSASSSTTSNFDLIIHEKDRPDTVIGSILSTIGTGSTMKLENISYGSKVGQLRQVMPWNQLI